MSPIIYALSPGSSGQHSLASRAAWASRKLASNIFLLLVSLPSPAWSLDRSLCLCFHNAVQEPPASFPRTSRACPLLNSSRAWFRAQKCRVLQRTIPKALLRAWGTAELMAHRKGPRHSSPACEYAESTAPGAAGTPSFFWKALSFQHGSGGRSLCPSQPRGKPLCS